MSQYENNAFRGILLLKSFLRRSLWGPYVKGRFHNRSSGEPIRRGAFVKGPFVMGGGGGVCVIGNGGLNVGQMTHGALGQSARVAQKALQSF